MRAVRDHWIYALLCAGFLVVYGVLVVVRHESYGSHSFDLGIFDQAIWHYSRFEAPASTIRGFDNLLGDHFHPILALAAPAIWVWDDARALLLVQVGLFVLASVPVYLFGRARFGLVAGLLWACAFLVFWGVQSAIEFDVHEVAFAVPLIAFGLWLILEERFVPAACCVAALLLVKEDLSFLVVAFGVVFLLYRRWWLGAGFIAGGLAWFLVITKVVMPRLAGGREFAYWSYTQLGSDAVDAVGRTAVRPWKLVTVALDHVQKRNTAGLLFGTFALLPFLSLPALILCVPLVAERLLSTIPAYWGTGFHYSATISPVLALGAIDGLSKLRGWLRLDGRFAAAFAAVALVPIGVSLALTASQDRPLKRMTTAAGWARPPAAAVADAMLARIPDGASVTAQDQLLPHLTHRERAYQLVPGGPATDWVAAATTWPHFPTTDEQYAAALRRFRDAGYVTVFARDGFLLLRRPGG